MDYSSILEELSKASLFDLYRLDVAIRNQLEDPKRVSLIKGLLKIGQTIRYFEAPENRLIDARIVKLKRTRVLVENIHNGEYWNIPYYFLNIDGVDTDILATPRQKITKSNIKVGDKVCFKDRSGNEKFGEVFKLNQKTAGVLVGQVKWRVAYGLLAPIIDGELGADPHLIEGKVLSKD